MVNISSTKTNRSNGSFLRINAVGALLGFIAMLITAVIISLLIAKIKCYERFYPAVALLLTCIPSFVGAKSASARLRGMLIPTALLQGITTVVLMLAVSALLNGSFNVADRFTTPLLLSLAAAIIAVLLPTAKKKKH